MIVQAQKALKLLQEMIDLSNQYDININAYMIRIGSGKDDKSGCVNIGDYDFNYLDGKVHIDYAPLGDKKTSMIETWEDHILPERIVDLKAPPKKERPLQTRQRPISN